MARYLMLSGCVFLGSLFGLGSAVSENPCRSGLQPGQKPGPYSAVISTGPERGQSYCYVCETGDKPAVVVFARDLTAPLGKLVHELDQAVLAHQGDHLRGWVTFLHADQTAIDPKVVEWGRTHAIGNMPLGVFEDAGGPPSYRLAPDAEITVLLFVKQRVVANFAMRHGELDNKMTQGILQSLPLVLAKK